MKQINDKRWCVYMHTNKTNNKVYVGIAKGNPKQRWKIDGKGYLGTNKDGSYKQPVFARALNKYKDWDNDWEHIIVCDNLTHEEATLKEVELIALYKSNCNRYRNPSYGYNMTDGGEGSVGPKPNRRGENHHNSKPVYCIELEQIFANANIASQETGISAGQIRACCKGEQCVCMLNGSIKNGLHWIWAEDISKEKIQEVLSQNPLNHLYTPVYCIELDKYFESIQSAEQEIGIIGGVAQVIAGQAHTSGMHPQTGKRLHWLRADNVSEESIQRALNPPEIVYKGTEVYCVELDLAFISMCVPCKALGISTTTMRQHLQGTVEYAGLNPYNGEPLHWVLLSDYKYKELVEVSTQLNIDKFEKKIYCIELDMYFSSIREAAKLLHTSRNTLKACLREERETAGFHPQTGEMLHWEFRYNKSYTHQND